MINSEKPEKVFRTEFAVRGYELDGYGHVNHAVYLNYAEYARWCMIEESGAGSDYFKRNNISPVVVRVEAQYKEPCYLAEKLIVETRLKECRNRAALFEQRVLKASTGRMAAEVLVTLMGVDSNGKAVRLPADFESVFGGSS